MAFQRPSLNQIYQRILSDIRKETGVNLILQRSFLNVFAKAIAGASHTMHGFIEWAVKQIFVNTAEKTYLERHAATWGVGRKDPSFSNLQVTFSGVDGSQIPEGLELISDSGLEFTVDSAATISSGTASTSVTCTTPGTEGNLSVSSVLRLITSASGVETETEVSSLNIAGEDQESDASLRARLIDRIQRPPSGGNANDYIQKVLEVPGVTRAWVFPEVNGRGTVGVKFTLDEAVDIIPDSAKITEVQSIIDEWAPITADVEISAPSALPLDMEIKLDPNNTEVQTAVENEIRDLLIRTAQVSGAYSGPSTTYDGKILLSKIREAISIAVGEEDHEIVSIMGSAPENVIPSASELVTPGTITWQNI